MEHNRVVPWFVVPWFVVPFFKPWIGLVWMVGLVFEQMNE